MQLIEAPLIESFILLNQFFQRHQIRYCLIGGIAAGFWGEARFTHDIDFTVVSRSETIAPILEKFRSEKFTVIEKGAAQAQVVQKDELEFQADLILAETDYQDWVVQRAIPVEIFDVTVPICTAEDLIILKLIANRRVDYLDIENILRRHETQLDKEYLKKWLVTWELVERFEKEFRKVL